MWFRRKKPETPVDASRLRIAGIVPCAGSSRRMGRSKALLDAGGRSFLAAVVGALTGGGCDPVVLVTGPEGKEEARRAKAAGALVVVNPDPGEGPITSIRLALSLIGGQVGGVAVCPVDHPLVRAETVAALLRAFAEGDEPLVLPLYEGERGHPGIFRSRLFPELLDPELEGGARTVAHRHLAAARLVPVDDPGILQGIDTPESYVQAFGPGSPS